jgi:hypothetical protein
MQKRLPTVFILFIHILIVVLSVENNLVERREPGDNHETAWDRNNPHGHSHLNNSVLSKKSIRANPTLSLESISSNLYMKLVAGLGTSGYGGDGGPATLAAMAAFIPWVDSAGYIYESDNSFRIRKINQATGIITTVGGTGSPSTDGNSGPILSVSFNHPYSIVGDAAGTVLYYSDQRFIWKCSLSNGFTSVYAHNRLNIASFSGDDGQATSAQLNYPAGLWLTTGDVLYFADVINHRIRKILQPGIISTAAGSGCTACPGSFTGDNGPAISAALNLPRSAYMDTTGKLFIADTDNLRIRVVDTNNMITTFAGTGNGSPFNGENLPATSANINSPYDVKGDLLGNIYIADQGFSIVRVVDKASGLISTLFGTANAPGYTTGVAVRSSSINGPKGLALDTVGNIYVSDGNSIHRSVDLSPTSQPSRQPTTQPSTQPTVRISSSLKNGLVAYYPFDGNANDNSGNGNHGTLRGGVSLVADRFGLLNNAYNFDGSSACIEVPGQQFNFISNMSVSLWVKPATSQQWNWNRLLDKGTWNRSFAPGGWAIEQSDNHLSNFLFHSVPSLTKSVQFTANQWNHLGMTKKGKSVKMFINGKLNFTTELSGSGNIISTGNIPLTIGCNNGYYTIPASGSNIFFKGALDEIMIYDRVLTASEMIQLSVFDSPMSQPSRQPSTQPSTQPTTQPTVRISSSLKNGLVAYYPFDGNANDNSGNGNHGAPMGNVQLAADRFGSPSNAYSFTSSPLSCIKVDNGFPFQFIQANFTISMWLQPAASQVDRGTLIEKSHNSPSLSEWTLEMTTTNQMTFFGYDSGPPSWVATPLAPLSANAWNHVVAMKTGKRLSTYVNGIFFASVDLSTTRLIGNGNLPLYIGCFQGTGLSFTGIIDEVFIFNRSLSNPEIRQLYNFDTPTSQPSSQPTRQPSSQPSLQPTTQPTVRISTSLKNGLVAYYPFDGNANDNSGNGNHGMIRGGVSLVTDRFGYSAKAYTFDGSSGFIEIVGQQFNFANNFTISLWLQPAATQVDYCSVLDKSSYISSAAQFAGGFTIHQYSNVLNSYFTSISDSQGGASGSNRVDVPANAWSHVVVTKSGRKITNYLNNVMINSVAIPSAIITSNGNLPLLIGGLNGAHSAPANNVISFYRGTIDEVFFYNRTLTVAEIRQLYYLNFLSAPPYKYEANALLLWYPFITGISNYASGSPVADATLMNGASIQLTNYAHHAASALVFNGQSQYMSISSFTTGTNGLTFAFWFKSNYNSATGMIFDFGNGPDNEAISYAPGGFGYAPGGYMIGGPPLCNTNVWCFIAVSITYSTSPTGSTWTLYLNGTVYNTKQNPYLSAVTRTLNYLGKSQFSSDPYYVGMIGEFRLYQTVLSPAEIQSLYSGWVLPTSQPSSQPSTRPTVRISSSLKNGLIAFYPFDGNANDNSGNGNHGRVLGGVSLVSDRFGQSNNAYNFDESSACVEVPGQQFNFISNMSISLWVKPASSQSWNWNRLLDKGSWNKTFAPGGWAIQQFANHLNSQMFIPVTSPGTKAFQLTTDQWSHLGIAKNRKIIKVFINGKLNFTTEMSGNGNLLPTGSFPLMIGCSNHGYTNPASQLDSFFNGALDDIMIYDRVLTDSEMAQLNLFDSPTSQPSQQPSSQPSSSPSFVSAHVFSFTGTIQNITVPSTARFISVDITGAAGGSGGSQGTPGYGARVQATIPVTGGSVLHIYVGGQGGLPAGGWNGGGAGFGIGSGGGGATDIRVGGYSLTNRIVVAGGGGGRYSSGDCGPQKGGDGGRVGTSGSVSGCHDSGIAGGGGGTATAGGTAGQPWNGAVPTAGSLGLGGTAAIAFGSPAGGGGGGYYGGK